MAKRFLGMQYPIIDTPHGLLAQNSDVDQIKADLLQLLLTNPGERCLTGDTMIPLFNGTEFSIKDLVGKDPFLVYSYDKNNNSIVAGKAEAFETLKNAELIMVTLTNGKFVKCTPDHLWLLRDGNYCRADKLSIGDSLMFLHRNESYDYRKDNLCLAISNFPYKEDCYDLKVEQYHNFALSAECFVHNCMMPTFGIPLRNLMFEPNDASLAFTAKQMIAEAIATWEPRIVITNIEVKNTYKDASSIAANDEENDAVLYIKIEFVDPKNISEIDSLVLELPIGD